MPKTRQKSLRTKANDRLIDAITGLRSSTIATGAKVSMVYR